MRNLTQLAALQAALGGARTLSVYLDGTARDPARQLMWRKQLDHSIADLRTWLEGSPHAEREEFEHCVALLEVELKAFNRNVAAPGWVAFITANGVQEAFPLPVPMPTQAVWSTGISVAPYMRALKEALPVALAVVDSTKAIIYRYHFGTLEHIDTIRAHHTVLEPVHMGNAPRAGFHTGTRGSPGRDEAQRSLLEGTRRMLAEAAEYLPRVAGTKGWMVVGGIPAVSRQLADRLSTTASDRVLRVESLDVHAAEAELKEVARSSASSLRRSMDAERLSDIASRETAEGLGTMGPADTRLALDQSRVRELYVTHRYVLDHAAEAEDAVRSAIAQGAVVEEVSGELADVLDARGGVAARLRYRMPVKATRSWQGTG